MTNPFERLSSDGASTTLSPPPEERAIAGEELWWPPGGSAGVVVTEQTALQNAALLATVNVIGTDVAVLPLSVRQMMPDGSHRDAPEHPIHELLCRSPDGESTPLRWKQSLMSHALIYGNGYAEIQRRGDGRPYALHLLDPASTSARRDREKRRYYETGGPGGPAIPAANVLHIAGLGFDGISGYNLVRLLRQAIGLGMAGETYAADFFANGSESGGSIEVPGRLKDQAAVDRVRNGWEGRHQGAGRRHRVAVLEEGAKYTPTSTDPTKSQLLETRKFQVIDTTRAYRIPPHKIGDLSEAHLANIEASNLDYLMTALMGWLVVIEQELDLKLFTPKEWRQGYRARHDTSALLRGDSKGRYDSYSAAIRDGWLNRNEVRALEGKNPIPAADGGDLYTVQAQVVPIIHEGPETPAAPAPATPAKEKRSGPEPRFNPNHGHDGKFAGGHGGGGHGGAAGHSAEAIDAMGAKVVAIGKEKGAEYEFSAGGPRGPAEAKLSARAEAAKKLLIREKVTAYVDEKQSGDHYTHTFGGHVGAETFPYDGPRGHPYPEGDAWVSRQHNYGGSGKAEDSWHDTRKEALKDSRSAVWQDAKEFERASSKHHTAKSPADFEKKLAARDEDDGSAGKWSASFHVVTPAAPPDEGRSESRYNPNHGKAGRFTGGSGGVGGDRAINRRRAGAAKDRGGDHAERLDMQHAERKETAQFIRGERKDQRREHAREIKSLDRGQAGETRRLDARHARELARSGQPEETAARHAEEKGDLAGSHAADRADLLDGHREAVRDLRASHKEAAEGTRQQQRIDMHEALRDIRAEQHEKAESP